jgi:Helix-turn-helix domain of resolvase
MPAGRPTLYRPEYCERVIEMGEQGYSVVEMAAELNVVRATLEGEWLAVHPEFLAAFTQARQKSQAWWERQGRENVVMGQGKGTFNASMWSRSMAARFPKDWRESKDVQLSGKDGGPVEISAIERHVIDPKA